MTNQNRRLKGMPGAGEWTTKVQSADEKVFISDIPSEAELPDVATCSVEELRLIAETSSDPLVLAELTSSPRIPDDVLERLAAHDQPASVRLAAAQTGYEGTGDRAALDPNPLVRAMASAAWDLSPENREAIQRDGSVKRILEGISV